MKKLVVLSLVLPLLGCSNWVRSQNEDIRDVYVRVSPTTSGGFVIDDIEPIIVDTSTDAPVMIRWHSADRTRAITLEWNGDSLTKDCKQKKECATGFLKHSNSKGKKKSEVPPEIAALTNEANARFFKYDVLIDGLAPLDPWVVIEK